MSDAIAALVFLLAVGVIVLVGVVVGMIVAGRIDGLTTRPRRPPDGAGREAGGAGGSHPAVDESRPAAGPDQEDDA